MRSVTDPVRVKVNEPVGHLNQIVDYIGLIFFVLQFTAAGENSSILLHHKVAQ